MSILLLILGLLLFVGLVAVHEYGHYKAAKSGGVEVEEFGIGFPPTIWKKHLKNGTLFTLSMIPLGGFVRLKGEHDADRQPGSYGAASDKTKLKIMLAGVVMNLLVAFGLLSILALIGTPKLFDGQFTIAKDAHIVTNEIRVGYIEPGSPAEKAGLEVSDRLIATSTPICDAVDGGACKPLESSDDLLQMTEQGAAQPFAVEYERDGETKTAKVTLRSKEEVEASKNTDSPKGYLGIAPTEYTLTRYTWSAPIVAGGTIVQFTGLTLQGLGSAIAHVFSGQGSEAAKGVAGPVGIFVLVKDGATLGLRFILMIMAVISLTLAIMNALPIPALDGGKLFLTLLFRALKKPLTPKIEEWVHGTGFAALIGLFILITIVDIRRFF